MTAVSGKAAAALGVVLLAACPTLLGACAPPQHDGGASSGVTPSAARSSSSSAPSSSSFPSSTSSSSSSSSSVAASSRWRPSPGATWQIQYEGAPDLSVQAQVFDLDGHETPAATVAALQARGVKTICYFNAGGHENWRPDAKRFPAALLGEPLDDWPGERWLDIRRRAQLLPIMTARIDECKKKGFDAVDPDNLDGYATQSGFPLTQDDARAYVRELAKVAHDRGLAIGLKNALEIAPSLVHDVDFAVNEQCVEYEECDAYGPFLDAKKAVFNVEYEGDRDAVCAASVAGISTIIKSTDLTARRVGC